MTPSLKDHPFDLFDELRIGLERPLQSSEHPNAGTGTSLAFDRERTSSSFAVAIFEGGYVSTK